MSYKCEMCHKRTLKAELIRVKMGTFESLMCEDCNHPKRGWTRMLHNIRYSYINTPFGLRISNPAPKVFEACEDYEAMRNKFYASQSVGGYTCPCGWEQEISSVADVALHVAMEHPQDRRGFG